MVVTIEEILLRGYEDRGRTFEWGKNLTPEQMDALRSHEIFTLLDADGKPVFKILMDSYGTIREKPITEAT